MTDTDTESTQETAPSEHDDLRQEIRRLIDERLSEEPRRSRRRQDPDDIDIESQVAKAVEAAKEKDKQSAADKRREAKIKELEDRLASKEKKPREHRKITQIMKWVTDDDE